ncbi:MAG: hypothetical protein Q7T03_01195 [Deltaproteobacteria bacterium]|nr:hypothetical protein [Deltaproteobacteria bacterium]
MTQLLASGAIPPELADPVVLLGKLTVRRLARYGNPTGLVITAVGRFPA